MLLSDEHVALAEQIAAKREATDRVLGSTDLRCYAGLPPDFYGTFGEVAACIGFGLDPFTSVRHDKPDDGIDLTLRDGRTVSIKTTRAQFLNMLLPEWQRFRTDIAVLVWPGDDNKRWLVIGWCTKEQFFAQCRWLEKTGKPCQVLSYGNLESPTCLNLV